jgi:hypothetical protein
MKKQVIVMLVALVALGSCKYFSKTPKGYHHVELEKGLMELDIPDEFTVVKDSLIHVNPEKNHDVKTFRYSTPDSTKAIGVAFSKNAETELSVDKFQQNVAMQAAQSPNVKVLTNDTMTLNGNKVDVLTYNLIKDSTDSDYSRTVITIINKEVYTVNMYFKGKVLPEYGTIAETVTKSFKVKPAKK